MIFVRTVNPNGGVMYRRVMEKLFSEKEDSGGKNI